MRTPEEVTIALEEASDKFATVVSKADISDILISTLM